MTKTELEEIVESKTEELEELREELVKAKQKLKQKEIEKNFRKDVKNFAKMSRIAMDEFIDQGFSEEDAIKFLTVAIKTSK